LNNVNIEIEAGEFVAIMGPSGCGKSTLLNIIGMLDVPSSGQYIFQDQDISGLAESELGKIRKHQVGFIFQSFNLINELTVADNIELALLYHDLPAAERKQRVAAVMDKVGIAHRAKHQSMILADEPTGNLDSAHGQEVMEMLQQLNKEGTTIVMVTHSAAHSDYARRTINLFDGHVVTQNLRAAS
jgi:putative ABC transport system ATP-binding protein